MFFYCFFAPVITNSYWLHFGFKIFPRVHPKILLFSKLLIRYSETKFKINNLISLTFVNIVLRQSKVVNKKACFRFRFNMVPKLEFSVFSDFSNTVFLSFWCDRLAEGMRSIIFYKKLLKDRGIFVTTVKFCCHFSSFCLFKEERQTNYAIFLIKINGPKKLIAIFS